MYYAWPSNSAALVDSEAMLLIQAARCAAEQLCKEEYCSYP